MNEAKQMITLLASVIKLNAQNPLLPASYVQVIQKALGALQTRIAAAKE